MTEEIILNYSANHIFREGYEQGRADAELDFQNSDYWNDYLAEIKRQMRVDSIDKIMSYLNDCRLIEDSKVCYKCLSELMEKIEQLKEESRWNN